MQPFVMWLVERDTAFNTGELRKVMQPFVMWLVERETASNTGELRKRLLYCPVKYRPVKGNLF